jgi:hypothetical protein
LYLQLRRWGGCWHGRSRSSSSLQREIRQNCVSRYLDRPIFPFGWFREWEKPRAANKLRNQDEISKPVFVPPSPPFGWFKEWDRPRAANKLRLEDYYASPVFTPVTIIIPNYGWFTGWPEYIFKKEPKRQDWLAAPTFVPPDPPYAWAAPWCEPTPRKKPNQDYFAEPVFAQPAPAYSWFQPFAEPIRWKRANQDWISAPVFTPVSVVTPSFAWFTGWPEYLVRKAPRNQDELVKPVFAQPAPPYSWALAWSEPIRFRKPNQDSYAAPVFTPPAPNYSWALPWNEPVRKIPPRQSEIAKPVFVPPVPAFSWFGPWSEPTRRKASRTPDCFVFGFNTISALFFLAKGIQVLQLLDGEVEIPANLLTETNAFSVYSGKVSNTQSLTDSAFLATSYTVTVNIVK